MTGDAAKRALEAAADALRRPWPEFPTRGMTAEQQRDRAHQLAASAVVAAFLRAMQINQIMWVDGDSWIGRSGKNTGEELAAAVTQAAQEGGGDG